MRAHTHTIQMVYKRRGSECTQLSVVLLSGGTGRLGSRAHILYLICSRLALHNVNIILRYPGTVHPPPAHDPVLYYSQRQGLHRVVTVETRKKSSDAQKFTV